MASSQQFVDAKPIFLFDKSFENRTFESLDQKIAFDPKTAKVLRPEMRVHNARQLQEQATSLDEFFHRFGFVLLRSETAVKDWNTDPTVCDNDIVRTYHAEIEDLVKKELFPNWGVSVVEQLPYVVRRGPGVTNANGQTSEYGPALHQDFGLDAIDYEDNLRGLPRPYGGEAMANEWRSFWDQPKVQGMMVVNFWRPVEMKEPLRHTPLCVCDPATVKSEDMIRVGYRGPEGKLTNLMMVRPDPEQRWYYYPEMRNDEVLVFKQMDYFKEDGNAPKLRTCFHGAFKDPSAPRDCAPRQSSEHRIHIYFDQPRPQASRL